MFEGELQSAFFFGRAQLVPFDKYFRFVVDGRIWWNRFGQPDVPADDRVVSDHGVAAQNGASGIDDHVVFDGRMALLAAEILGDERSSEGYSLVDFYVVSDDGGLSDDDAGAVVDVEMCSDTGSGVDVDPRAAVGILGDDPGQDRNAQTVHDVGDAVDHHGIKARITQDDLFDASGGGVGLFEYRGILQQLVVQRGNLSEKLFGQILTTAIHSLAQRTDNFQKIDLQTFPPYLYFGPAEISFFAYREQQVGQGVHEMTGGYR